jgi:CheY-like chemotaxis protein
MKKNALIVDDDRILRHLIKKKFQAQAGVFTTLLAADGVEAVKVLKENAVSIVVTDLHMPNMDGFELLAHMSEKYPDIPVIVLTAYSTPQSKQKVLDTGAAGFIEKPFVVEDLADNIIASLEKESEGGTLQTVSIDMFLQLVEMEQKTCTIRVINKDTEKKGVLFFKGGELLDARIRDMHGKQAAYEIFSWDSPSLSIQDTCVLNKKVIKEDLQAVLFDAMRLKDEAGQDEAAFLEAPPDNPAPVKKPAAKQPAPSETPAKPVKPEPPAAPAQKKGIASTTQDAAWDDLMASAASLGSIINAGNFKACYIDQGRENGLVLQPGDVTTVVALEKNCPGDVIRRLLYE